MNTFMTLKAVAPCPHCLWAPSHQPVEQECLLSSKASQWLPGEAFSFCGSRTLGTWCLEISDWVSSYPRLELAWALYREASWGSF